MMMLRADAVEQQAPHRSTGRFSWLSIDSPCIARRSIDAMNMRCMRLGGLPGLAVGILVLLSPLAVQGEEPAYTLTPWDYGMIAWVGGTPADAQSASLEITQGNGRRLRFLGTANARANPR